MKGECEMGFDFGGSKESLSLSLLHLQKMSADVRGLVVCVQSVLHGIGCFHHF